MGGSKVIDKDALIKFAEPRIEEILIELNIEYRRDNGWWCINCPFHDGADGFNLKYRDGAWYCFSVCKCAYSMFDLIAKVLNIEFVESMHWLANFLGVDSGDFSLNEDKIKSRENLKTLKSLSKKRKRITYNKVQQTILNDIEPYHHPYLLKQGYNDSTLTHFNIGYARTGVFQDRVCFPIDAPDGTTISVSGRSVYDINPKYYILGSSDKSTTLYNISRIGKSDKYIIVVEGFKSCLSLYQWGYQSVVAVMGADISEEQTKLLLKLGRKVICIGDNDEAGQRLNQKIYNRLYKWLPVIKIDMGEFTQVEKASPCDLDFDDMAELDDKLQEVINE